MFSKLTKLTVLVAMLAFTAMPSHAVPFETKNGWKTDISYGNLFLSNEDRNFMEEGSKLQLGDHLIGAKVGRTVFTRGWGTISLEGGLDYHLESDECMTPDIPPDAVDATPAVKVCLATTAYTPWIGGSTDLMFSNALSFTVGGGVGMYFVDSVLDIAGVDRLESEDSDFALNLHAGLDWWVAKGVAVGGEVRYFNYGDAVEPATSLGGKVRFVF